MDALNFKWGLPSILVAVVFTLAAGPSNSTVIAALEDFTNGGGFFAEVTFDDVGTNTVKVTADIADPINVGLTQGDILGLWFDIADETVLSGLTFGNQDPTGIITASLISANGVDPTVGVGSSNNAIGGGGNTLLNFDIAVALGTQGGQAGFVQTLSFEMTSIGLSEDLFLDQRVGMRVQSIVGGVFDAIGSSKLLGEGAPGTGGCPDSPVPTPAPLALFGVGGLILGWQMNRKSRA